MNVNVAYADVIDSFSKGEYRKLPLKKLETMCARAQTLVQDQTIKRFTPTQRKELITANRAMYGHLLIVQEKRAKGLSGILRGLFSR